MVNGVSLVSFLFLKKTNRRIIELKRDRDKEPKITYEEYQN
jgi:hypothetical protein